MGRIFSIHGLVLAIALLVWTSVSYGQAGSTAKACGFLPIAELEAHFGVKAAAVRGLDTASVSMCSSDLPDRKLART